VHNIAEITHRKLKLLHCCHMFYRTKGAYFVKNHSLDFVAHRDIGTRFNVT